MFEQMKQALASAFGHGNSGPDADVLIQLRDTVSKQLFSADADSGAAPVVLTCNHVFARDIVQKVCAGMRLLEGLESHHIASRGLA